MPSLSDIISVSPLADQRCLGHSLRDNRRCPTRIDFFARQTALDLLALGSRRLGENGGSEKAGELLKPLAVVMLCREHRRQLGELVTKWWACLLNWELHSSLRAPPAPAFSSSSASSPPPPPPPRLPRFTMPFSPALLAPTASTPPSQSVPDPDTLIRPAYPSTPSPSLSSSAASSTPTSTTTTSTTTSTTIPTPPTKSRFNVIRREVTGDCGICMLPFTVDPNAPRLADSDGDVTMGEECDALSRGDDLHDHEDLGFGSSDAEYLDEYYGEVDDEIDEDEDEDGELEDDEDEDDDDESEDEDENERLARKNNRGIAWCKVKCGTNYHRSCLNTWITTFKNEEFRRPTCPTCRAVWKE